MRKKKLPWKSYVTECKHCGQLGKKMFPKEKYLHAKCKRIRHKLVIKRSIITIKLKASKETKEYLCRINRHLIKKERRCLGCDDKFMSNGSHNRLCNKCNEKVVFIVKIYKNPKIGE